MRNNVLAVIVTFNRLKCLKDCLESLRTQTCKCFDILVVNNGSTDGTKEYLESQIGIIKIHQNNLGGAGGFCAGMKYMYEHKYEWLWMMDDDGIPATNQLEILLKHRVDSLFLNALVINKDDHNHLAFENMECVSEFEGMATTDKVFHPFNGTFIHWSVIDKVGLIKKEMFIWGDEQEYRRRVKSFGYKEKTVVSAIHYHPREKGRKIYVNPFTKRAYIWDKPKNLSWIYYRNLGYIDKSYKQKWYSGIKNIRNHIVVFSLRLQFRELFKFIKYYIKGRNGEFDM